MKKVRRSKILEENAIFNTMNFLLFQQLDILQKSKSNTNRLKSAFAVIATLSMLYEACLDRFVEELKHESKHGLSQLQLNFLNNINRFRARDKGIFLLELMTQRCIRIKTNVWKYYFKFFEIRNKCMHPRIKYSMFNNISLDEFLKTVFAIKNLIGAIRYGSYFYYPSRKSKSVSLDFLLPYLRKYIYLNKSEQKKAKRASIKDAHSMELNRRTFRRHIHEFEDLYNIALRKYDIKRCVLP